MKETKIKDLTFELFIPENQINDRLMVLAKEITLDFQGEDLILLGILNGSFIVMADLVRQIDLSVSCEFIKISSYKGTETTGTVKSLLGLSLDLSGKNVLIVEDIVDTGLTLSWLKANLESRGAADVKILTILRKPEAAKVEVDVKYVGFDIPKDFVVGYGLDFDEKYRNLSFIGVLAKHMYE